jgi:SAM-dependent methyltransferase
MCRPAQPGVLQLIRGQLPFARKTSTGAQAGAPGRRYARFMSAAHAASHPWHRNLPAIGTDEQFAALRRLLEETDYSEDGIRKRLNVETLDEYSTPLAGPRPVERPLDVLIRLFFDCVLISEAGASAILGPEVIALLDSLKLLVRDPAFPEQVYASAAILPAAGIVTVCDRGPVSPDGTRTELPEDVVYPPIFDTTKLFLKGLPQSPCEALLDLGTGAGVAAILRTPFAKHVWASDISERCVHFTEFNRRLAGISNMSVVLGDLYGAVAGLTFDRIVTHPPYVPENRVSKLVFRDAGQDGEQIIRRAIEGVPGVLRPGGRFYSLQMATDREGEKLEDRVRKWLGAASGEFDVVVLVHSSRSVPQYLAESAVHRPVNLEQTRELVEMWQSN